MKDYLIYDYQNKSVIDFIKLSLANIFAGSPVVFEVVKAYSAAAEVIDGTNPIISVQGSSSQAQVYEMGNNSALTIRNYTVDIVAPSQALADSIRYALYIILQTPIPVYDYDDIANPIQIGTLGWMEPYTERPIPVDSRMTEIQYWRGQINGRFAYTKGDPKLT